jgi:hypothetical protein
MPSPDPGTWPISWAKRMNPEQVKRKTPTQKKKKRKKKNKKKRTKLGPMVQKLNPEQLKK